MKNETESSNNESQDCSLCSNVQTHLGSTEDKILKGNQLAFSSFFVFIGPFLFAIMFAATQKSDVKKFIATLTGFIVGIVIARLVTKLIIRKTTN